MPSLLIATSWPSKALSPNGPQLNIVQRRMARAEAKNEAYIEAFRAKRRDGWQLKPGRIKVTIHARPATKRNRDDDNLIASVKPHLDGIATCLKVNDALFALQPIDWLEPAKPAALFFEIEIEP